MAERFQETIDRKAQAVAERVFTLVHGYSRRIIQARTEHERDGYKQQISGELAKVRKFVMGEERAKLNPHVAHRLVGEYTMNTTHLEQAIIDSELAEAPITTAVDKLKTHLMPIPKELEARLQFNMGKYVGRLQGTAEVRDRVVDPAFVVFFYDAGMKRMAMPNFEADEWYGEAMSTNLSIVRKCILPVVVVDQLEQLARERARAMPNAENVDAIRHRALNALDELIELWAKDMPAVADKYQMVKDVLDQEMETLSEYHRHERRK